MPKLPTLLELLQAGVHFGHKVSRWHPKMEKFIFGARNGIHIIDLNQTITQLDRTLGYINDLVSKGGTILFLGTKRQARDIVKKYAEECGMPYITERWLGGTFTNFAEVGLLIKKHRELKEAQDTGKLAEKYTKKEQVRFRKQLEDLESKIGGILNMTKLPDAVFVIDVVKEKTAVQEAGKRNIPVIALADTNVNPEKLKYAIPSNDDAVKTIDLMCRLVAEAVNEGKANQKVAAEAAAKALEKA